MKETKKIKLLRGDISYEYEYISVAWIAIDSQLKQKCEENVIILIESKFLEGKTLDMGTSTTSR